MRYDAARRKRERKYDEIREEYQKTKGGHQHLDASKLDMKQATVFPKDRVTCPAFKECAFDFGCTNYDPKYLACEGCTLKKTGDICTNKALHNDETFSALIERPVYEI